MKMMSLFDGSGGFPLAASLCGIEPVYASEVEPYPIAVTRSRFPNMIHLGDVSKVHGGDLEPVDVITFGSPCQDMSIAGKRAGIKHEENGDEETTRSGLFMEAARIIQEMREATNGLYPTFAVWENVPGAFSSNKGEDFRLVLQTLVQIVEPEADVPGVPKGGWAYADCWMGPEWSIAYRTFDAQYWGVPQRRRRIYLVLDLRGRRAGKVLFERKGLRGHFAAGRAPWEGTAADAPGGAGVCDKPVPYTMKIRSGCEGGGKGPLIQEDKSATLATNNDQYLFVPVVSAGFKARQGAQAKGIGWQEERSHTLTASNSGTQLAPTICVAYDARGNGDGKTASTITGDHESRITDYTTVICLQGEVIGRSDTAGPMGPRYRMDGKAYTLDTKQPSVICMAHGQANAEICDVFRNTEFGGYKQDSVASALKSRDYKSATDLVVIQYIVRRLVPTECARIQGFPGRWGDIDPLDVSDEAEVALWRDVYKTYCIINGLKVSASILSKPDRLKKWHDKLRTVRVEYKMWGNGIALPNALYVMQGIEEAMNHV